MDRRHFVFCYIFTRLLLCRVFAYPRARSPPAIGAMRLLGALPPRQAHVRGGADRLREGADRLELYHVQRQQGTVRQ